VYLPRRSIHRNAGPHRRWLSVLVLLGTLASSACGLLSTDVETTDAATVPTGFVESDGTRLVLDGKPFFFTGMNIYNAANNAQRDSRRCWYPMGSGDILDRSLTALGPGTEVIRAWFFQTQATDDHGQRDWSGMDHTLATAKAHGMRVIPVLVNQWGNCEGTPGTDSGYKNDEWYRSRYRSEVTPGTLVPYRDWVTEVVTRYRNDPTILAWQLVNEAEAALAYGGDCPPTATETLVRFATDMANLVKSIDPNHLLSLGTIGSGQCGTRGAQYQTVHAVRGIDLCEYHDYDPTKAIPGDQWNGMAVRLRQCRALGKPLITGEVGILNTDTREKSFAGRARLLNAKLQAQQRAGAAGVLVWAWRDARHGGSASNDFYVGPADPMLAVLRRY
jgi:mannan endo-1,4-beta-mannosidase